MSVTLETLLNSLLVIQALAVLTACGSVLFIAMGMWRSMGSFERKLARMDSFLNQIDRANTKSVRL